LICILCERLSFRLICKECQFNHLSSDLSTKMINQIPIYSFYKYDDISDLILLKYKLIGQRVFKILAQNSLQKFSQSFEYKDKIYSIPIDDNIDKGYSHSSILSQSLKSKSIKPLHNKLISKSKVKYSNKSLEYRLKNPRDFNYKGKSNIDVILVDDIVVTGLSIKEAIDTLSLFDVNVLFVLCLCDNREF